MKDVFSLKMLKCLTVIRKFALHVTGGQEGETEGLGPG